MGIRVYLKESSPPARALLMTLHALELPHESISCDLLKREHLKPEYLEKNPLHTIPMLEDGDLTIQDSHAAIIYLIEKYGKDDSFYPKDIKQRTLVNQKLFMNNSVLFPRIQNIFRAAIIEGIRKPTEKQLDDIKEAYGFLEKFLSQTKYLAVDHITLADIAAITTITSLGLIVPLDQKKFPKTYAWVQDMGNQTYCKKINTPGVEAAKHVVTRLLDLQI